MLQAVEGPEDLLMESDQASTGLAELAVGSGEAAPASEVGRGERAEMSSAGLAPRKDGGGLEGALGGRAMARRFAAAGLQFIDGALEEVTQGEDLAQEAPILVPQLGEKHSLAAGLFSIGQGRFLGALQSLCYIS